MVSLGLGGHSRSRRTSTASSARSSVDEGRVDGPEDETTVVEPEQGNVLSHIISQLRPGADLSRVVLPTFILEPRSMLERITNFMAHPENLLPIPEMDDPVERFVAVTKFYLSGWHIKPPGVKKPLNPILGETFTCYWEFPDNTKGYYISEQTSHHPPKSSYFYAIPEHHIRIDGCLKPRSKFLGNSAASLMEGIAMLRLTNRGENPKGETYSLTQPNMYARGILFGKMKYELGDHSYIKCPENQLSADIEFKTKGYFGGTYNAIGGVIRNDATGEVLYELEGMWTGEMIIKDKKTGKKTTLFDATHARYTPPTVRPMEVQEERESQRLWYKTAQAVKARDHETATDEKTAIEEMQRQEAAKRAEDGVEWHPILFRQVNGGPGGSEEGEEDLDWILTAKIDGDTPQKQIEQILAITPILPGQKRSETNQIPKQHPQPTQPSSAEAPLPPGTTQPQEVQYQQQPSMISQEQNPPNLTKEQGTEDGQEQQQLEAVLASSGTKAKDGPLLNFQDDLRRDLNATPTPQRMASGSNTPPILVRVDTESSEKDEFVDAEG